MKLEVSDLTFFYEKQCILNHISFALRSGEFVSILGPSGAGKSTILKLLAGVLKPDTGTTQVDGETVTGISDHFAYMPQNDLLFPWKNILDNVCLYGKIHREAEAMKKTALGYFPAFGLAGCEYRYPSTLSGGMRQRAAFLRTALCRADILLLDEPFGALDVITREEMQDWLLSMRKQLQQTVLLVTHDMDEAIYLSDRILILNGTPAAIRSQIPISAEARTRKWLYSQGKLRQKIYETITMKDTAEDAVAEQTAEDAAAQELT